MSALLTWWMLPLCIIQVSIMPGAILAASPGYGLYAAVAEAASVWDLACPLGTCHKASNQLPLLTTVTKMRRPPLVSVSISTSWPLWHCES